jgi:hypothetical protein
MSDSEHTKSQEPTPDPRPAQAAADGRESGSGRLRRRRFRRAAQAKVVEGLGAAESLASLRAELVLLREENASLKAAQAQGPDLGGVLRRARAVPNQPDRDDIADEATQLLVEGLVLRESLLEVCQEIERSMVAVEAKLNALTPTPDTSGRLAVGAPNGHVNGAANGNGNGHAADALPDIRLAPNPDDTEDPDSHGPGLT